jgi:hypothetical protein
MSIQGRINFKNTFNICWKKLVSSNLIFSKICGVGEKMLALPTLPVPVIIC